MPKTAAEINKKDYKQAHRAIKEWRTAIGELQGQAHDQRKEIKSIDQQIEELQRRKQHAIQAQSMIEQKILDYDAEIKVIVDKVIGGYDDTADDLG